MIFSNPASQAEVEAYQHRAYNNIYQIHDETDRSFQRLSRLVCYGS